MDSKPSLERIGDLEETQANWNSEVDVGYGYFLKGEEKHIERRDDTESLLRKRVLRKIDFRILPIMYSYPVIFSAVLNWNIMSQIYSLLSSIDGQ